MYRCHVLQGRARYFRGTILAAKIYLQWRRDMDFKNKTFASARADVWRDQDLPYLGYTL